MAEPTSGAASAAVAPERGRAWPWKVCIFLLFATMLSYLDRQALSVVAPTVKAELGLDNEKLGRLFLAFFTAYGVSSVVGWRMAFVALGACGLVWALGWVLWFRPPAAVSVSGPSAALPAREREPWAQILRLPRFWACVLGAAFTIPIIHIMGSWVPMYLSQTWKIPLGAGMAAYLFLIYLGLDLGFLTGGAVTSLLVRRGVSVPAARKMVMAGSTALILLAAAVPRAPSVSAAVALVALVNAGRAAWGATFLAFNQEIAPGRVATMAGFMGFVGAESGALLSWAIGVISRDRGFGVPFMLVAVLGLAGLVPMLLTRWGTDERR